MHQAVSNDRWPRGLIFVASAQAPQKSWSQWETVSKTKDRREEKSSGRPGRWWEPVARQTDRQINRRAGYQTACGNTPVVPASAAKDRVSQTENKEGGGKKRNIAALVHSLWHPLTLSLASISVTLSFTFSSQPFSSLPLLWWVEPCLTLLSALATSLQPWPPWPSSPPSYHSHIYLLSLTLSLFLSARWRLSLSFRSFASYLSGLAARQTEAAS